MSKKCVSCNTKSGKRYCIALEDSICTVCCGTKRIKEINCKEECEYLETSKSISIEKQFEKFQQQDDMYSEKFIDKHIYFLKDVEYNIYKVYKFKKKVYDNDAMEAILNLFKKMFYEENNNEYNVELKTENAIEIYNKVTNLIKNEYENYENSIIMKCFTLISNSIKRHSPEIIKSTAYLEFISIFFDSDDLPKNKNESENDDYYKLETNDGKKKMKGNDYEKANDEKYDMLEDEVDFENEDDNRTNNADNIIETISTDPKIVNLFYNSYSEYYEKSGMQEVQIKKEDFPIIFNKILAKNFRAWELYDNNSLLRAKWKFNIIIETMPVFIDAYFGLASIYVNKRKFNEAIDILNKAKEIYKDFYSNSLKSNDILIKSFENILFLLTQSYVNIGDYPNAGSSIEILLKATKNPNKVEYSELNKLIKEMLPK